jgi:hypothetical protein
VPVVIGARQDAQIDGSGASFPSCTAWWQQMGRRIHGAQTSSVGEHFLCSSAGVVDQKPDEDDA